MLEQLFSSKVRAKVLTALFRSPGIHYNAYEIAQLLGENYSAVYRELARLEKAGLLESEQIGRIRSYQVNPDHPITPELRSIVLKTDGAGDLIRQALVGSPHIVAAFIFGSYASGKADKLSDLDLMIIGEVDLEPFSSLIANLESDLRRPVNYVIYTPTEWQNKIANRETFVMNIKAAPKVFILGGENAL